MIDSEQREAESENEIVYVLSKVGLTQIKLSTNQQSETKLKALQNNDRNNMYCIIEAIFSLAYWLTILTLAFTPVHKH